MERGLPSPEFKLRPRHALFLVDLVLAAVIFYGVGRYFMAHHGTKVIETKEKTRIETEIEGKLLLAQADSVMIAEKARLEVMRADSARSLETLNQKRQALQAAIVQHQQLTDQVFRVSDVVQGMKTSTAQSAAKAEEYEANVEERSKTAEAVSLEAQEKERAAQEAEAKRKTADQQLKQAITTRTYEPASIFPERSGVSLEQAMASGDGITGLEVQHVLRSTPSVDLGLALGIGLGSGDRASSKQVGLLLSKNLIHRRLGLDFTAGLSSLTDEVGKSNAGAFAGAALRYSPFYKERFHLSLGANADHGEILPYVGIGLGRR
jgi:hypothetical protein